MGEIVVEIHSESAEATTGEPTNKRGGMRCSGAPLALRSAGSGWAELAVARTGIEVQVLEELRKRRT
jgi:hypothetical protein